jgi:hypothetical protein
MSSYGIHVPSPDEINYHEARQVQRVEAARKVIDVGDVIAIVESRLSQESDPPGPPAVSRHQLSARSPDRRRRRRLLGRLEDALPGRDRYGPR